MRSEREYALLPYLAYSIVPFYPLFQERGGPRVERPKADWEVRLIMWPAHGTRADFLQCFQQTKAHEDVCGALAQAIRTGSSRMNGGYRDLVNEQVLHLEFVPYLNRIISPPLRPVSYPPSLLSITK